MNNIFGLNLIDALTSWTLLSIGEMVLRTFGSHDVIIKETRIDFFGD